jgi:hypothetical protein
MFSMSAAKKRITHQRKRELGPHDLLSRCLGCDEHVSSTPHQQPLSWLIIVRAPAAIGQMLWIITLAGSVHY